MANAAPIPSDLPSPVSTAPSTPRIRLARIEANIAALEVQLDRLRTEKEEILRSLSAYPILTIPPEITIAIFLSYIDTSPHVTRGRPSPVLLASVCRAWRAISLGTGELWARMHFTQDSFARMREPMKLLDFHLTHAAKCLLDLYIELPELAKLRDAAWAALRPCSGQLRSLVLVLDRSSFLDGISESLPSLRKLDIQIRRRYENTVPIVAFAGAPQLREAHIMTLGKDLISLPWQQLTALTLEDHNFDNCLYILEETPRLQQLHLNPDMSAHEYAKPVGSFPTCTLPDLHTLRLSRDPHGWLIHHLALPRLKYFEMCMVSPEGVNAIDALVCRSACEVHTFEISFVQPEELRACLAALPTVRTLTLSGLNISADQLKQLFSDLSGTVTGRPLLLPALTTLILDRGFTSVDVHDLAAMLVARWDNRYGARITSFSVSFDFIVDHNWLIRDTLTRLRDLCRSGLTLSVFRAPRNPTLYLDSSFAADLLNH
ncbi:hypothetical protein C8F04DRAFT_1402062 [Mycena alexandri]|uniref:F-box domain-containing protein n=1 Tax=Mycena alexandri TaxID=1745969 RepID=A0AAD6S883_9AGAR|nr:hypothetical protein C8F04DRAFT_1402062 [Mycena alexandri]